MDDVVRRPSGPAPSPRDGPAIPMTVLSLLRPGGVLVQRVVYAIGRARPPAEIDALRFIHFARLGIIRRFPDHGQPPEHLRQPLQFFESNYNGVFDGYIDAFVDAVPQKMRAFWGTSYGFPFRLPLPPFKRFIRANLFPVDHYYAAYPAPAAMIGAALHVKRALADFHHYAVDLDEAAFADEYRRFVTAVQEDL